MKIILEIKKNVLKHQKNSYEKEIDFNKRVSLKLY